MQTNPNAFMRARQMMAAIAAAMALPKHEQLAAMAMIPSYKSHGHGKGKTSPSQHCVAMDKRAARKSRNVKRHKATMRRSA